MYWHWGALYTRYKDKRGIKRDMKITLRNFIRMMEDDTEYIAIDDDYVQNKHIVTHAKDIPEHLKSQNVNTWAVRYAPEIDQVVMHISLC